MTCCYVLTRSKLSACINNRQFIRYKYKQATTAASPFSKRNAAHELTIVENPSMVIVKSIDTHVSIVDWSNVLQTESLRWTRLTTNKANKKKKST